MLICQQCQLTGGSLNDRDHRELARSRRLYKPKCRVARAVAAAISQTDKGETAIVPRM